MPALARSLSPPTVRAARRPSVEQAVLATLAYADLFDHPLSTGEVHADLVVPASPDAVRRALEQLTPDRISRLADDRYCLRGREAIAAVRRARVASSRAGWRQARRFARWLALVPFVRAVAVCGSLAADNADDDGDVDLFLITAPNRLWLVQTATMVLRRLARRRGHPPLCPNTLLAESDLELGPGDLYLAHEVTQARPLLGDAAFRAFRQANAWTRRHLPQQVEPVLETIGAPATGSLRRLLEALFAGRLGDALDRLLHRLMLAYYTRRLRRYGWTRDEIARTYRRDRQTVMTGGYRDAVAARFAARCGGILDDPALAEMIFRRGFDAGAAVTAPETADDAIDSAGSGDPLFAEIFDRRYGSDR